MLQSGTKVLAEGNDIYAGGVPVAQGLSNFFIALTEADQQAALGDGALFA